MGRHSWPSPAASLRLLVVDDEPELAELIAEFGRRAGYDATCTSDPDDFDRLYHDDFDVIVLDLWMPRRDGIELLRHLAERHSRARVILVSGFDERVLDVGARPGGLLWLERGRRADQARCASPR